MGNTDTAARMGWIAVGALALLLGGCPGSFPAEPETLADASPPPPADAGCDPVVERCNGLDDDCDGEIDEGLRDRPCPGGVGVCSGATSSCRGAEGWGPCDLDAAAAANGLIRVGAEGPPYCEGRDDDCDGTADEGCECQVGEARSCGTSVGACLEGTQACPDGRWGGCVDAQGPTPEACNDADDDCDGEVDEGVLNACGACGPVPVEICDGADDDCDGEVDEGVLNACGTCGDVPAEICNAVDDDCDGETDEGALNACGACGPPPVELCNDADDDCDGAVDEAEEICNGVDDDCDDAVDELAPRACMDCSIPPCVAGVLRCEDGVDTCEVERP